MKQHLKRIVRAFLVKLVKIVICIVIATRIDTIRLGGFSAGVWMERTLRFFLLMSKLPLPVQGFLMYPVGAPLAMDRYEPGTTALFYKICQKGMNVVDIGACSGYYTLLAARAVGPIGKVWAFEPDPQNLSILKKNIELNGYNNIIIAPKAVGDKKETRQFYIAPFGGMGSSFYFEKGGAKKTALIETTTLDDFFEEEGWPEVHLVKIDAEGAEFEILKGAKNFIQKMSPELKIILEFAPINYRRAGVTLEDFMDLIHHYELKAFEITDPLGDLKPFDPLAIWKKNVTTNLLLLKEKQSIKCVSF